MKRIVQHPLAWCGFAVAAVALLLGGEAPGQPALKLPAIDTATHMSYTEELAGTRVKFDMVAVPGGTYLMGSPAGEPNRAADEGPQHPVTVRPFWMGKCECHLG